MRFIYSLIIQYIQGKMWIYVVLKLENIEKTYKTPMYKNEYAVYYNSYSKCT